MQSSVAYHAFRVLWFLGGLYFTYSMCLMVAVGAAMTGPFGGFTKHEKLSMNSLMLFSSIAALLGILAIIGSRYRWIRASGQLMLYIAAPILLGIHLNYTWASSGPVHRLDSTYVVGLLFYFVLAIALWELNCKLGRRQANALAEQAASSNH